MEKIKIDERYPEAEETGRSPAPYEAFFNVLKEHINFSSVGSFIDVGCADGHLMKFVQLHSSKTEVAGIDYFEYHKKYADDSIAEKMRILDIRNPLGDDLREKKFDIVVCTEVGEHIEPEFTDVLLQNLKSLTGKYLIMTWSCHGGSEDPQNDPNHQHLNPLSIDSFIKLMTDSGFRLNVPASQSLIQASLKYNNFSPWWRESLTVWEI